MYVDNVNKKLLWPFHKRILEFIQIILHQQDFNLTSYNNDFKFGLSMHRAVQLIY